jgi:ubiquinone/menaquinone biosynthesis C-methylase UbiE
LAKKRRDILAYYTRVAREQRGNYDSAFSDALLSQRAQEKVRKIVSEISSKRHENVLDIGCGTGRYIDVLTFRGENYVGLDISSDMIRIAASAAKQRNLKVLAFVVASADQLPFRENVFDLVTCIDVLHHLDSTTDRERVIKEVGRISRPQAEVIVEIKNRLTPWMFTVWRRCPAPVARTILYRDIRIALERVGFDVTVRRGVMFPLASLAPIVVFLAGRK